MSGPASCLLVSYTDLGVNSTDHVVAFGVGLVRRGWDVRLAVHVGGSFENGFAFFTCDPEGNVHRLSPTARLQPADVVHVWTPRAPIWRFLEQHQRLIAGALVLHLEDDETEVLRLFGASSATHDAVSRAELRAMQLEDWTHPLLARCLSHAASGTTVLSPELAEGLPASIPSLHVIPPLAPQWSEPLRRNLLPIDIRASHSVVYTGGLHPAVADDFFELCRAVNLLRQRGHRVRLIRCGPKVAQEMLHKASALAGEYCDVGHLSFDALRELLATATVLVQPGAPTKYNRGRLPAKLAPYLASGTPVVMPANYSWLGVENRVHAVLFSEGWATEVADAIEDVLQAPEAAREMGARAAGFARKRFDLLQCCAPLDAFYRSLPVRASVPWQSMRNPRVELPLLLAASSAGLASNGGAASTAALLRATIEEVRAPARSHGPLTIAQLFWPTRNGYEEHASSVCVLRAGRWSRLSFGPQLLPAKRAPRLDPGDRPGILEITAINYRTSEGAIIERHRPPEATQPVAPPHGTTIALPPLRRNVWRWLSTGKDPQLLLPEMARDAQIRIECWIRWTAIE